MGTSLIVVCVALASLQAVRVQRRMNDGAAQSSYAKKLAQSGIEFMQQQIQSDPNWRSTFSSGSVTRSIAGGSFSVTLSDPRDGSINNSPTDPVLLVSTGTYGSSIQKLSAYLEPQSQLVAACRSSLYAVDEIEVEDSVIDANQWAYCEDKFDAKGDSILNVNCHAKDDIDGDGYSQRTRTGGTWPMERPNMTPTSALYIGNIYMANGIAIDPASLPTGGQELIKNGEFEVDVNNWTGLFPTRDTSQKKNGVASCRVPLPLVYLSQNITPNMVKGHHYRVVFWIRPAEKQNFRGAVQFDDSEGNSIIQQGTNIVCEPGVWTQVTFQVEATWSGVLNTATLCVANSSKLGSYNVDSVSIMDLDREVGTRYIENALLDDARNPFGTVSTNGIYSIDVPGEKIIIRNSRINATLVVKSASRVEISEAVTWEPSGRNYPALIANAVVEDRTSAVSVAEPALGVNLNKAGSPFAAVVDGDALDSYPNTIKGAILSTENIELHGTASFTGPIVSSKRIFVRTNSVKINFPSDMILNPPPGFFANPPKMRLIAGSVQSIP